MEEATIALEAELSTGVWTDLMPDVLLDAGKLHLDYGVKGVGPNDRVASTGILRAVLDNRESNSAAKRGYYTPTHADCRPGFDEGIQVRTKFTYGGMDFFKWRGGISGVRAQPGYFAGGQAALQAVDWMDQAAVQRISQIAIQTGKRIDQLVPYVLADMPIQPRATSLATGVVTFGAWFNTDTDEKMSPMAVFQKMARNEAGYIYPKGGSCPAGLNVDLQMIAPYDGSPNSNEGHVGTPTGGVIYLTGKHGQGVQIAKATVNQCKNPSFEVNVTDYWDVVGGGAGAVLTRDTAQYKVGVASAKLRAGISTSYFTTKNAEVHTIPAGATVTLSCWLRSDGATPANLGSIQIQEYGDDYSNYGVTYCTNAAAGAWERRELSWTNNLGFDEIVRIVFVSDYSDSATSIWFDACQLELQTAATPYCDGTLGTGHSWAGTAHNSTSSRTVATLTYVNPLSAAGGSLAFWWKPSAANTGPTRYFFSEGNLKAYFNAADDKIYLTDGTNTISTAALTFSADVLQHLVFTWGTAGLRIIRNGVSVASGGTYTAPTLGATLYVGSDTAGANQCDGLIDDLGIAFYPITVAQANAIYGSSGALTAYHATQEILRFESRNTRTLNESSIVALYEIMDELDVSYARENVFNLVKARVYPLKVDAAATTVLYTSQKKFSIGAGLSITIDLSYRDPITGQRMSATEVVSPLVADTDYKFGSSEGTANDLNASLGISLVIGGNATRATFTNNSASLGYMNLLQLRGKGITAYDPQVLESKSQTSINKRGELTLPIELEQIDSPVDGQARADYEKNLWSVPTKLAKRVRFLANKSAALMTAALGGEPGDRFTLVERMTAIASDYFINAVELDVEPGGPIWCTWTATPADTTSFGKWNTSLWNEDFWAF